MDSSDSKLENIYLRYFIMESVNGGTVRQLITSLADGKGGTLVELRCGTMVNDWMMVVSFEHVGILYCLS